MYILRLETMRARLNQMSTTCLSTKAIDAAEGLVTKYGVVPVSMVTVVALAVCTPVLFAALVLAVPVALMCVAVGAFLVVPALIAAATSWYMFPSVRELKAVKALTDKVSTSATGLKSYGHAMLPVLLAKLQGKPTNGAEPTIVEPKDVPDAEEEDDTATTEVAPAEADAAAGGVEEKAEELAEAEKELDQVKEDAEKEEEEVVVLEAPVAVPAEKEEEEAAAAAAVVEEEPVVEKEEEEVENSVEQVAPTAAVVSDDDAQAPSPAPATKELSPSTSPAHPSCVSDGGSPTAEASDAVGAVPSDDVAPSMPLLDKADVVTPSSPKFDSPRTAAEVEPALDHEVVAAEVTEFAKTLAAKNAGGADGSTPSSPNGALKKKRSKKKKAKKASRSKSPPRATA